MPLVLAASNPLQPLINAFEAVLVFFHDQGGFSWGLSIILLTICVRLVLLPLTLKQMKSMQRMAKLQPQLKALQAKYKDDKQRLNQEVMGFYRENKVNPFASCLPLVAQLPVFISLFYMLRKDLRHDICPRINPAHIPEPRPCGASPAAHFLGIPDITDRATGTVLVILLVLYVGSQLLSGVLSTMSTDKNQRFIMLGLPLLFVGFIQRFPAGLILYWITTNVWTVGQGIFVRRTVGPIVPPKPAGEGGQGGLLGGLSDLFARPSTADGGGNGAARDGAAGNGGSSSGRTPAREPAGARSAGGPPPPSPRKKKKRSGRRR